MSDQHDSPKLKRKREGMEPLRKKIKTQRKSIDTAGGERAHGTTAETSEPIDTSPPTGSRKAKKNEKPKDESALPDPTSVEVAKPREPKSNSATHHTRDQTASKRLLRKQKRKEKEAAKEQKLEANELMNTTPTDTKEISNAETANHSVSRKPKGKKSSRRGSPWAVSEPLGGWFIPQSPVFTADEKFLILATTKALHIYATDTSLLTRTLPDSGFITAYALSASNPNRIYAANSIGLITLWDWAEGTKVARWEIESDVRNIAVVSAPESGQDLLYCHEVGQKHVINVHALRTREQGSDTELKRILKAPSSITGLQVLLGGKLVVTTTQTSVLIGRRSKTHKTALQDFEYIWREVKFPKRITAYSAYARDPAEPSKGTPQSREQRFHLGVAIGDTDGMIHLLDDILSSFASLERAQKPGSDTSASLDALKPRRLHWHREAVGSVHWSRDGNYLISGGNETVLVLWQLSTGKQQVLPHLTAAIENIVVSPAGSSYSITLANNSVIVLSTTELEAKTNITGIQSRRVDRGEIPRNITSNPRSLAKFSQLPFVTDPKNNDLVIFPSPSSQPRESDGATKAEPYIQTFNIATQYPISRQAMTRNNATDFNMRPDGGKVVEPNISFLQISHDGRWLATVDEWIPPHGDMSFLDEGIPEFNNEEHTFRCEVYLKFWRWDAEKALWALESRITSPHFFEDMGASARVLDLVSDPSSVGFATIGEDRSVRFWQPKTRMRDGTLVRGADNNKGDGLVTWSINHSVELSSCTDTSGSSTNTQPSSTPFTSRLAFSPDGSVLAVGISSASESDLSIIHLIDATVGSIRRSLTELNVSALSCLGILGHHLIVVGESTSVWDLVLDELVYSVELQIPGIKRPDRPLLVRLAIDQEKDNFALAWPQFEVAGQEHFTRASSKISIFHPYQPQVLWSTTVSGVILSMTSLRDGRGYITLDSRSSLRIVSPKVRALQLITPAPENASISLVNSMDASEVEEEGIQVAQDTLEADDLVLSTENDKPVVRPEQLQNILDHGPSQALPPVKELFNAVVGLYARKPRTVSVV